MRSRSFRIQHDSGEDWGIAGFSEDITECKQAEEILHHREQEFRSLVEHSPDIIFRVYSLNADNITLEFDINDVTLNLNTAILCGLIISELV